MKSGGVTTCDFGVHVGCDKVSTIRGPDPDFVDSTREVFTIGSAANREWFLKATERRKSSCWYMYDLFTIQVNHNRFANFYERDM
jgi:hypothetical protein